MTCADQPPVIVLVTRRHREGLHLAASLSGSSLYNLKVVHEIGSAARRRKLSREWRVGRMHALKFLTLDAPALALFKRITAPDLGRANTPKPSVTLVDVNDRELERFIAKNQPELILNYGTSIYTEETLSRLLKPVVNIHDGIIPTFRNVHTDFWAYFTREDLPFGVTLFEINRVIDAGKIVRQQVIAPDKIRSFRDARQKLADLRVALALSVVEEAMRRKASDRVAGSELDFEDSWPSFPLWSNPTFRDVLTVVLRGELRPRYVSSRCR